MKTLLLLPLLLIPLGALASGCRSTSSAPADLPCICGTPEADLEGCPHSGCLQGKRNPDNPDCVCGNLSIPR